MADLAASQAVKDNRPSAVAASSTIHSAETAIAPAAAPSAAISTRRSATRAAKYTTSLRT